MKASWPAPRKVQSRPHDGRSRPTRPPPAPRDPFALVCSLLLVPLLVSGDMATTLLTKALGTTARRWRGLWLAGFAVATGLVIDLITTYWLKGLPSDSSWIVWPILALIILTVSLLAAVLRRLVGPLGIFLTVIVVIQFGNPSSGGANGVPYLPAFWMRSARSCHPQRLPATAEHGVFRRRRHRPTTRDPARLRSRVRRCPVRLRSTSRQAAVSVVVSFGGVRLGPGEGGSRRAGPAQRLADRTGQTVSDLESV